MGSSKIRILQNSSELLSKLLELISMEFVIFSIN